jgi:carboxylesterase
MAILNGIAWPVAGEIQRSESVTTVSETDRPPVLPGAEPFSRRGGPHGVLVVHGFTGTPQGLRGLAEAFATAGFAVELPLLPGHGTTVEHMMQTSWSDWSAAADAAYQDLAGRCDRVVVAGLSMGGTIACWLAGRHPEIAGIVVINGAVLGDDGTLLSMIDQAEAAGMTAMPAVGGNICAEGVTELAYESVPFGCSRSLILAVSELQAELPNIRCPVLIMNSPQDHVVPPASSDHLAASVSGPVERLTLERSYHVATLDHDRELLERHAVEFAGRVASSS